MSSPGSTAAAESLWTRDPRAVWALAAWLVDEGILTTATDVLGYFERPHKWTPERRTMLAREGWQ